MVDDSHVTFGMIFNRLLPKEQHLREPERIEGVMLSVQASEHHYCSPKKNGLDIEAYSMVEVGIRGPGGKLCRPSEIGVDGFDHLFGESTSSPIAPFVKLEDAKKLRKALMEKAD